MIKKTKFLINVYKVYKNYIKKYGTARDDKISNNIILKNLLKKIFNKQKVI
jgi:hypothetical protein